VKGEIMKDYVIRQEGEADCGACCLYSIIKYFKGYVPLEVIKVDTLTTKEGTSFYNLKEAGIKYGFEVNGYKVKKLPIKESPFIVQLKIKDGLYHFVVVYQILDNAVICMDPSIGIKKYSKAEFYDMFTGNVLKFNPINKIISYQRNNYIKNSFLKMIKNNLPVLLLILIMSIVIVGLSLFNTYNIKLIFNYKSIKFILLFIILMVIKNILSYVKGILLAHINKSNNITLITDYITHFFFLPFKYLQLKSAGEITSRINDLNNLKDFLTKEVINIMMSLLILFGCLIILFILNKLIAIILLILAIVYLGIIYLINDKSFRLYLSTLDSESKFMDQTIEYINKIKTIKNLNKENYFLKKLSLDINNNYNNYYNLNIHLNKISLLCNLFNEIGLFIILFISLCQVSELDNILIYILYYNYFIENINYFASLMPEIMYFKSVCMRVNGIYYLEKENYNKGIDFKNNDISISQLNYQINLNKIFSNFNLKINKGEKVLLVGSNGVGKSTLLNILNNNIDDYEGEVKINHIRINDINKKSLKNNIYYSSQNDTLFVDTILNNIILDKLYNEKKLKKIEKILDLKEIVNKKVGGYNSLVKDNLSGGEKQRIILARALYQDFNILLLDESLSEVSNYLRLKIINNINYYYKDKTIIYVSHFLEKYPFDQVINLTARKDYKC
jgi:ATP-binding cassette subfamily B protein